MLPIIVVDDDPSVAEVMALSIEDGGYPAPEVFNSPQEVISWAARNTAPFVLLTDFRMPRMNGLELIEELHRRGRTVHAILVTGAPECIQTGSSDVPILEKGGLEFADRLKFEVRRAQELCTA